MITLKGYKSCESLVDTQQFNLLRVEEILNHEIFIAKIYTNLNDQQILSLKNTVALVKENNWTDALQPIKVVSEDEKLIIIFKNTDGCSIQQFLKQRRKLMPSEFIPVAISLCKMLSSFHTKGWILRNIRPDYIFIDPVKNICKLLDFRKASKVFKKETDGTNVFSVEELYYISPEQTGRTNQKTDYRSDFYSLGILFYELLTGKLPFNSKIAAEIVYAQIAKEPDALNTIDPYMPHVLNDIVMKLLNKNPEDRYQSLSGLLFDLQKSTSFFQDDYYLNNFKIGTKDFVSHITIPAKLMGRENELELLNDAYLLAQEGKKQTFYITGYSGVGKTRLVQEFQQKYLKNASFTTKARFDKSQMNLPYPALIQAIRELIRNLLRQDEGSLNYWKERLMDFLKGNGQIIINVVPELGIVIGEQHPVDELSPDESQNRFQRTFLNFIAAFSSEKYVLVIFLDDLQWADIASIKLIEMMVLDINITNFYFLGAYREQDVNPTDPLMISLLKQEKKADIKEIQLLPLEKETTGEFILEALQNRVEKPDLLIEKIFQKTNGNIFFTIQLITSLNDAGLLYKSEEGDWKWNERDLQEFNLGESVIDLLVQKINALNQFQKTILRTGACVGNTFDLFTVANISGMRLFTITNEISSVINMGYLSTRDENLDFYLRASQSISDAELSKLGNVRFQFSHNRIQQACISLVNEEEIAAINYKAGQFKLKRYTAAEIDAEIFTIANHLNKGRKFIQEDTDLDSYVDINFSAGKKAMNATAYESAIEYFNEGRRYLNFDHHYRQLYNFFLQEAECKYHTGQYDEAEHDLDELYNRSKTNLDKLEILFLKVYICTSKDDKEKAVNTGRTGFSLYGLNMPKYSIIVKVVVFKDIIKALWTLRGKKIDHLQERGVMKNTEQIRFLEFIFAVSPSIYQYDQNLFAWDVMKILSYSLKNGNNGVASFGYLGYGMIIAQLFGNYKKGKKLADIGLAINKQLGYINLKWKVEMVYHNFVQHWNMPVRQEFDNIQEIINGCIANGDTIYAGYGIFYYHQKKFALGFPLQEVQLSIENYFHVVDQKGDIETRHFLEGYYHAIRCLRGEVDNVLLLGESFNVPERLKEIIATFSFSIVADTYIAYINILYQFQYFEEAWKRYLEGKKYMEFIYHRYEFMEFHFYGGLICAKAYDKKITPAASYIRLLKKHLKKLNQWQSNCPDNFEPQCLLLQAELARISGKEANAASLYEKAIQSADKYLFINIKALAYELAGHYHFSSGNTIIAKTYLDDARRTYLQWGAILKVKFLEKEFENLLGQSILERNKEKMKEEDLQSADVNLLIKTTYALNNTKDIDEMIEQLMLTVIQNSGANRGYILIRRRADLVIKAYYNQKDGVKSITEYPDTNILPLNIVKYVAKVKEPLIINNPDKQPEYSDIGYFTRHMPLSVLIYPILKQGELFGILYLENTMTTGVFDGNRIGLLNLISSQIVMLLDNAILNDNMENLVKERTFALETENDQISELLTNILPKEAIEELKATGKTTPQKLENVTVMIADIKGYTKISERMNPEELIGMIDNYFKAFDEIIGKYNLEKIKTIGDAYMAIGGIGITKNDGAEKMIQAALEMQEFAKKLLGDATSGEQIELRIGINSGAVIAGVVGTKKLQYDIWGDTVNVAARMEQNSEPSRVNISEGTYNIVKEKFNCIYRGKIEAKNKGEIAMYFVEPLLSK